MPGTIHHPTARRSPSALVLSVQLPEQTEHDVLASLVELGRLAGTLGIQVARSVIQKRPSASAPSLLGEGKLEELVAWVRESRGERIATDRDDADATDATEETAPAEASPWDSNPGRPTHPVDLVLVDIQLSPKQLHQLQGAFGIEVLDRTAVILRIFEERAKTRESKLEVEAARLQYDMARIRDVHAYNDREGGGGRGGRGNTNVELAKQRARDRLAELRGELEAIRGQEALRRARRRKVHRAALLGYTNAGKSSLMRALTGSEVLVEDKLFATLGTTVRTLSPLTAPPILLTDTVGFIRNLPHELVASFRSTLDEVDDASLLLMVVDASDPEWRSQLAVTRETIAAVGAEDLDTLLVLNKIDLVPDAERQALGQELPDAIQVSAHAPDAVRRLHAVIASFFEKEMAGGTLLVPYAMGRALGEIRLHARVLRESHTEEGTEIEILAAPGLLEAWRGRLAVPAGALDAASEASGD